MAVLAAQQATTAGLNPTYAAAAALGDTVTGVDKKCLLRVVNGHSAPQTVTLASQKTARTGLVPDDLDVAVPNAQERIIAIDPAYVDADGVLHLTYSGVTLLTVGVLRTAS